MLVLFQDGAVHDHNMTFEIVGLLRPVGTARAWEGDGVGGMLGVVVLLHVSLARRRVPAVKAFESSGTRMRLTDRPPITFFLHDPHQCS
jgi:hypothetical protein